MKNNLFHKNLTYSTYYPPMPHKLIAVTRTSSKGSSLRITLPKEIAEKLNVSESEHIEFYEVNGEIVVRKLT
jgi:AbrB family looped-hinge helix DNA binding protein